MGESIQVIHSVGNNLITQEKEGSVKLWELKEGSGFQVTKSYRGGGGYCKSVLFDEFLVVPQEQRLIVFFQKRDVQRLNVLLL